MGTFSRSTMLLITFAYVSVIGIALCHADSQITEDNYDSKDPCVGVGPDQLARVAWSSQRSGIYQICWATFDRCGTQTLPMSVVTSTNTQNSGSPRISVDSQNRSFIVWQTNNRIYFARITEDGVMDVPPKLISVESGNCKTPDIETTPNGICHVVYQLDNLSTHTVKYRVLDENGDNLNPVLTPGTSGFVVLDKYPTIGIDPAGNAYIAWNAINNWDQGLYYAIYSPQGVVLSGPNRIVASNNITWSATLPTRPFWAWVIYQNGNAVYDYRGGGPDILISSGMAQRPRMAGADEFPIYGVWQEFIDGTWQVVAREWDNNSIILPGTIRISDGDADATQPDIGTDGAGQYYVVWRDSRNEGDAEIYLDTVKPLVIRVTAQVRPEHDDDDFIDPPPALSGVTAQIDVCGTALQAVTGNDGIVQFAVDRSSVEAATLMLSGPYYYVRVDLLRPSEDHDPVVVSMQLDPTSNINEYLWLNGVALQQGPALQAAFFIEKFRKDYWLDRLNYEWDYWVNQGAEENTIGVTIHQWDSATYSSGGAYTEAGALLDELHFLRTKTEEADVVYHEYTHLVINERFSIITHGEPRSIGEFGDTQEGSSMDEALADYFAASFTNDPVVHDRDLRNGVPYPAIDFDFDRYSGSAILSGALWDLRERLDAPNEAQPEAPITDALVFAALDVLVGAAVDDPHAVYHIPDFYDALIAADENLHGGAYEYDINTIFGEYGLPSGGTFAPLHWTDNAGIERVEEIGGDTIVIEWLPIAGAVSYDVLANTVDYDPGMPGIGFFYEVASGITETTYAFDARDSTTSYLFTVRAVDDEGYPGYIALPVFVEELENLVTAVADEDVVAQKKGAWLSNYPNPFNPITWIAFEMFTEDVVEINIYDVGGKRVEALANRVFNVGKHSIPWNGINSYGTKVASGMYLVTLRGTGWMDKGKIVLLR